MAKYYRKEVPWHGLTHYYKNPETGGDWLHINFTSSIINLLEPDSMALKEPMEEITQDEFNIARNTVLKRMDLI